MAAKKKTQKPGFEEAIEELETLVSAMEQGDISLEQSLEYFQRGVELTRSCQNALQEAEQKVKILTAKQPIEGEDFQEPEA
ncbi:MAG: exodeoxyribonuclease VII small subunit [Gammaproteobacteria bacterium]|nr:exodeoxyribonuclease VII small subunit [Gammaproteobacteria bacterium]MDH5802505.1 exodeoxyribonuclease VII small subunit [Gammaproteobacteria bacterium]